MLKILYYTTLILTKKLHTNRFRYLRWILQQVTEVRQTCLFDILSHKTKNLRLICDILIQNMISAIPCYRASCSPLCWNCRTNNDPVSLTDGSFSADSNNSSRLKCLCTVARKYALNTDGFVLNAEKGFSVVSVCLHSFCSDHHTSPAQSDSRPSLWAGLVTKFLFFS